MKKEDYFVFATIVTVLIVSLVVIVGWVFGIPVLKSIVPDFVTMKFSTAVAFLITGIILLCISQLFEQSKLKNSLKRNTAKTLSVILFIFMAYMLLTSLLGIGSSIENLVVSEAPGAIMTAKPGLPSSATMISFVLIAIIGFLYFSSYFGKYKTKIFKGMVAAMGFLGLSAMMGYILNAPFLYFYFENTSSGMALHTAFLFILISIAIFIMAKDGTEKVSTSFRTEIFFGFFMVLLLMVFAIGMNSQLSNVEMERNQQMREINIPLQIMVEQGSEYDAILTDAVHSSVLHYKNSNFDAAIEHKAEYKDFKMRLDSLLKVEAIKLIEKSERTDEERNKTFEILKKIDEINLKRVDLESQAFELLAKNDSETAFSLITSERYDQYGHDANAFYQEWRNMERSVADKMLEKSLQTSKNASIINIVLISTIAIMALIFSIVTSISISNQIKILNEDIDAITKGNLDILLKESDIGEVNNLTNSVRRAMASMKLAILRTGVSKEELGLGEALAAKDVAEKKATELEGKYKALIESSPDCIKLIDLDGKLVYMSPGGLKEHRLKKAEDAVGWDYLGSIVEEQRQEVKNAFKRASNGELVSLDVKHIPEKATRDWCNLSLFPVKEADGKIKYIFGVSRDISDMKKIEEKMIEQEKKYKALYECSNDAIATLLPPDWKFTAGNPAAIKMFGAKDENDFTSRGPGEYSPEKQPDGRLSGDKAKAMIEKAMKEGKNFFNWTHKRINGEDFPATVLLSKVSVDGTEYLQATVRDLTEMKTVK